MELFDKSTIEKEIKELPSGILTIILEAACSINITSIAIVGGVVRDLIKKSNSGIVNTKSNYEELAIAINKFIKIDKFELKNIGNNGRKFYEKNFHSNLRKNQLFKIFR